MSVGASLDHFLILLAYPWLAGDDFVKCGTPSRLGFWQILICVYCWLEVRFETA